MIALSTVLDRAAFVTAGKLNASGVVSDAATRDKAGVEVRGLFVAPDSVSVSDTPPVPVLVAVPVIVRAVEFSVNPAGTVPDKADPLAVPMMLIDTAWPTVICDGLRVSA